MYQVYGADGELYGPVSLDELRKWIKEGRVSASSRIIDPITGHAVMASSIAELAADFAAATQPAPVQPNGPYGSNPPSGPSAQSPYAQPGPGASSPYGQPGPAPGVGPYSQPPGQNPMVNAPYGAPVGYQPKSKIIAGLLALFLGSLGIHRFYLGHNNIGVAMLLITVLTCGWGGIITGIWAFIDMILIFTGSMNDSNNQPLTS
jgi:TM2 domain-containing membrane protein YozV